MPTNLASFLRQIEAFKNKCEITLVYLEDEITKELFIHGLVEGSPVRTGFFQSQWQQLPAEESIQGVQDIQERTFIMHALVYANDTDYGLTVIPGTNQGGLEAGLSPQAPHGIVGPAVTRFVNMWDAIVARARDRAGA
jgi:hypothetical protein